MPDELVVSVATVLATKGAEAAIAGAKSAWGALVRLVRDRFGQDTTEAAALRAAQDDPEDQERRAELIAVLTQMMSSDPDFDAGVRGYWRDARLELAADHGYVANHFSGVADQVVQARDIGGGIRF